MSESSSGNEKCCNLIKDNPGGVLDKHFEKNCQIGALLRRDIRALQASELNS